MKGINDSRTYIKVKVSSGRWSRDTDLLILKHGTKWQWAVNTTPRPLPLAYTARYPVCKRLGWLLPPSSRAPRKENLFAPPVFKPRTVQSVVRRYTNHSIPAHPWKYMQ